MFFKKNIIIKSESSYEFDKNTYDKCNICGQKIYKFTQKKILNKYDVNYFYCENCGHIQTQEPFWLQEAYSNAIADTDIGILARNDYVTQVLTKIICEFFDARLTYLEYAGGYGILTRKMRDIGFNFLWQDKYCENIFAKGFEYTGNENIEMLTAVEVFEHFENPLEEIEKLFQISHNIFFTQQVIPNEDVVQNDWWYFSCETGQHISFYSNKTLDYIAEKFLKKHLYYNDLHLFTEKNISQQSFANIFSNKYKNKKIELKSKTLDDYLLIKKKISNV